jgi:hypothetical protein
VSRLKVGDRGRVRYRARSIVWRAAEDLAFGAFRETKLRDLVRLHLGETLAAPSHRSMGDRSIYDRSGE